MMPTIIIDISKSTIFLLERCTLKTCTILFYRQERKTGLNINKYPVRRLVDYEIVH